MSRSVSVLDGFVDTSLQLKSTNDNKNVENNKHCYGYVKERPENFDREVARVTICLPDCKDYTGFYTDITEKYLLVCLCPCHSRITSIELKAGTKVKSEDS